MKTSKNIFLTGLFFSLLVVMSCGSDDPAAPTAADLLAGTWSATSVTLDNVDVTNPEYSNFTINFNTDGSYITVDGDPAFTDTGGFWSVVSSTDSSISLDVDGVSMSASLGSDDTTATISFSAPGEAIGARVSGLSGSYVFMLSKQ